jgi:hypothetical protein
MTREFVEGRTYRYAEFKHAAMGVRDWPDDQLFVYRRGVFEALLEPFVDGREYTWAELEGRVWPNVERDGASGRYVYRDGGFEEVIESPHGLVPAEEAQTGREWADSNCRPLVPQNGSTVPARITVSRRVRGNTAVRRFLSDSTPPQFRSVCRCSGASW